MKFYLDFHWVTRQLHVHGYEPWPTEVSNTYFRGVGFACVRRLTVIFDLVCRVPRALGVIAVHREGQARRWVHSTDLTSSERHTRLRTCSHLVPEHSARALMWTHRFFKDPPQNSCPCPSTRSRSCTQALKWVFISCVKSEHSAILCRCPGTSARATRVNKA